jgi:hypothetical protein
MNEVQNIAMRRSSKTSGVIIAHGCLTDNKKGVYVYIAPKGWSFFQKAVLLFTVHIEYFHLPNRKVAARKDSYYCLQLLFNDSSQSLS